MNEQQIRLKLSRLPGDKLTRVAVMAQGVAEGINSKEDAVNVLTSRIIDERVTLDAVLAAVSHQPTQAAPVAGPDPRLDEALVNIQDRLKAAELKTQAAVEKAERDVQAKLAGVKSADSSLISETIRQEVAKVFAPFKQDTAPEVLAEVAARLPSFRLERAGDLFPSHRL
jgi:hypothetical protein